MTAIYFFIVSPSEFSGIGDDGGKRKKEGARGRRQGGGLFGMSQERLIVNGNVLSFFVL